MPIIAGEQGGPNKKAGPTLGVPAKTMPGAVKSNKGYGQGVVRVWVQPEVAPQPIQVAINQWNKAYGDTLFKFTDSVKDADIKIVLKAVSAGKANGQDVEVDTGTPGAWTSSGNGVVTLSPEYFSQEGWAKLEEATRAQNHDSRFPPNIKSLLAAMSQNVAHELGHALGIAHPYAGTANEYGTGQASGLMGGAAGLQEKGDTGQYKNVMAGGLLTQSELDLVHRLRQTATSPMNLSDVTTAGGKVGNEPPPIGDITITDPGGGSGGSGSGSGSGGNSSSSSKKPAAPKVDPVVARKESLFQSIYTQLWGEPATEAYLKAAVNAGFNTWEFQDREMHKPAWAKTKAYQDKAKSLADTLVGMEI